MRHGLCPHHQHNRGKGRLCISCKGYYQKIKKHLHNGFQSLTFQEFDLTDWGTLLGMGAYMGPDFSTDFMHFRAEYLYDFYGQQMYGKNNKNLTDKIM